MIPKIDSQIGVLVYTTAFPACGGTIRTKHDDFQVSELLSERAESQIKESGDYSVYILKKDGIDTNHALSDLFKRRRIRLKALGLKDAYAVTQQYVCANNKSTDIEKFDAKKYSIQRIGYTKKPLSKKDMLGNRFRIKLYDTEKDFSRFDEYNRVLNFYGYQRFGSKRPVTHLVGKAMVQKDFEKAVDLILSFTSEYDSKENTEIREKLSDHSNFERLIDQLPIQMDVERKVLREMIDSNDPKLAIKSVPLQLRRFFVQAYQSYIFNLTASRAFKAGEELFEPQDGDVCYDNNSILGKFIRGADQNLAIPMAGHSYYKKTRFDYHISRILEQEEVTHRDFFIKEMQETSVEGGFRNASLLCSNFKASGNTLEFTLKRGSFATILLREIMKPKDPIAAGF